MLYTEGEIIDKIHSVATLDELTPELEKLVEQSKETLGENSYSNIKIEYWKKLDYFRNLMIQEIDEYLKE